MGNDEGPDEERTHKANSSGTVKEVHTSIGKANSNSELKKISSWEKEKE